MGSVGGTRWLGLGGRGCVSSWSGVLVFVTLLNGQGEGREGCGIINAPVPVIIITPTTPPPTPPSSPQSSGEFTKRETLKGSSNGRERH